MYCVYSLNHTFGKMGTFLDTKTAMLRNNAILAIISQMQVIIKLNYQLQLGTVGCFQHFVKINATKPIFLFFSGRLFKLLVLQKRLCHQNQKSLSCPWCAQKIT